MIRAQSVVIIQELEMKVVFLSNFYNYHQDAFSKAMYERLGDEYCFVETTSITEDRKNMGWERGVLPRYVIPVEAYVADVRSIIDIANNADMVIIGSAPLSLVRERIKKRKLVFRYSERIFKSWVQYLTLPLRIIKYFREGYSQMYLLAASAFAYEDYKKNFCFKNRAYKWGYFPAVKEYEDIDAMIKEKQQNTLLWAGRFVKCKHPEKPIYVAKKLKEEGYNFQLNMIGVGEEVEKINKLISKYNLNDCVHMLGAMSPDQVRENMEQSQIFLFTSDRNEGWGAVLNEAMNSACAVVASEEIGSVPFLLLNGENGFVYSNNRLDKLVEIVKILLEDKGLRKKVSINAYKTIKNEWNADVAADRVLSLADAIMKKEEDKVFETGPCSKAII